MVNKDPHEQDTEALRRQLEERLKKFRKQADEKSGNQDKDNGSQDSKHEDNQAGNADSGRENGSNQNDNGYANKGRDSEQNQRRNEGSDTKEPRSKPKSGFSFFGGNKPNPDLNKFKSQVTKAGKFGVGLAALVAVGLFIASGFYTVNETQKGVVQRLGAYHQTTLPGLNWRVPLLDQVTKVNVQRVNEHKLEGTMLTRDENVVNVSMTIQFRVENPEAFLFNVDDPLLTLKEATESSLRFVVGHMNMDDILTTGRSEVRERTREELEKVLARYNTGIGLVDVNFQSARPPEEVKAAFDDAIKAQEDEQRFIREAEAYQRSKEPIARGQAVQIRTEAEGYAREVVAGAQAYAAQFNNLLPQYLANPAVFKQRYYLDYISNIYSRTPKVILEDGVNLNFLSLDKLLKPSAGAEQQVQVPYLPSSQDDSAPVVTNPTQVQTPSTNSQSRIKTPAPSRFSPTPRN